MLSLVYTFFRSKIRFFLSLSIFTILFLFLSLILANYSATNVKIQAIENKESNRELMVEVKDKNILETINEIEHIEKTSVEEISTNYYFVTILVDIEKNVDYVETKLKELDLSPYLVSYSSTSELESYKTVEFFLKVFTIILIILYVIIMYIEIKLLLLWDNKNIIMLKVLGYRNYIICYITMMKIYLLLLLSGGLSLCILLIINRILSINVNISFMLFPIVTAFIISFLQIPMLIARIKRKNINQIYDA